MTTEPAPLWDVLGLLNWTKDHFARAGVEPARLAAEILLARTLGCRRIELYTRYDYAPQPGELADFRRLVRRAASGEPIAYLVGQKEFYSMSFRVTPDVLIPRPETELLVALAAEHLRSAGGRASLWDVCTGSGCVAIAAAAHAPQAAVLGTDVSPQAIAVAEENAAAHSLADRVRFRQADLLTLPDDCDDLKPFGVITANPPYVAETDTIDKSVRHEPPAALFGGRDGLDFVRRIVAEAPNQLAPGGALILEFGLGQVDAVGEMIRDTGAFAEVRILRDHRRIERAAFAIRNR